MYVVAAIATWAVQSVINLALLPFTRNVNVVVRLALFVGIGTAITTWFVMPRAARMLERWLYALPRRANRGR
jgi:antibiotic biosynthesis monooxygenase (ABM) superfamily enzyme